MSLRPRVFFDVRDARQKFEIESHIQQNFDRYLILRLALVLSDQPSDGSLLSAWLGNIVSSKPLRCASDYICSPIYVQDVATAVSRLIDSGTSGLFHLGGPEALSRLDIGQVLASVVEKPLKLTGEVISCTMADFNLKEQRPRDISLCSKKNFAKQQTLCPLAQPRSVSSSSPITTPTSSPLLRCNDRKFLCLPSI